MNPIDSLHPSIREIAKAFLADARASGIDLGINEGYRSNQRQEQLYAQGRTAPGQRVTNARGGQSNHNYGLSFDVLPTAVKSKKNWDPANPVWQQVGALAKKHGFEWGGDWKMKDMPHIQARGTSWKTLRNLPVKDGYVQMPGGQNAVTTSAAPSAAPRQNVAPSMLSPEPMAQQFAPMQAPSLPFGDLVGPNPVQTIAAPQPQLADFLVAMQQKKAEQQAAEQSRLAALFSENPFGPFG